MSLTLGIDIGTSGVRACAIDADGRVVAEGKAAMQSRQLGEGVDATGWLDTTVAALAALPKDVRANVAAVAVDGTSGSMVLTGAECPTGPGLLYDSKGFDAEAERIAAVAPEGSIARGSGSALARLLRLQSLSEGATSLAHQADLVAAALTGRPGFSDESNALKTGYDASTRCWPAWMAKAGVRTDLLPEVRPVGAFIGHAAGALAAQTGIPSTAQVAAGATDSVAAFLAADVHEAGVAVTSLGTTLALKVLSDAPVEDAARGIYSHRIGDRWLPGGASNVGGGSLLAHFAADELAQITQRIDPDWEPRHLDTYPLPATGERFPHNEPAMQAVLPPRDKNDARFLFELLHAIARIEREGYQALASLGAPYPSRVLSAGGGARNPVWTAIRERVLGVPVAVLQNTDAAYGMALTARRAVAA